MRLLRYTRNDRSILYKRFKLLFVLYPAMKYKVTIYNGFYVNDMMTKENEFDLNISWNFPGARRYVFAFIALFILLLVIYANSFQGAFQFDDASNIVENNNIFLKTLNWSDVSKTFYGIHGSKIDRPLAYLSFAFNYYIDGLNVFGYHIVNFIIHYLTSIFLFLFIYRTLNLPILRERHGPASYSIALLAAFFWATNPVQVTAVTYIVQRMASMAGLFYIMSMYFYLKGRTTNTHSNRLIYFGLTTLSALLSIGTKENAIMILVSIWIYDLLLIQGVTRANLIKNLKVIGPVLIILAVIGLWYTDITSILNGNAYKNRPFTLLERLLTEPRIIIFYITLLLYPISSRLMLLHDIEISTSLMTPWSTLPAIVLIILLVALAIYISRKRPLIAFSVLFFFLNHIIEGSFIPLELIYEHRNYIPSMFFFVPLAILMIKVIDYFSYKKAIQWTLVAMLIFLLAAQGHTVYLRNSLFAHPLLLMEDNVKKAPRLSRLHHNLGSAYWVLGHLGKACQYYSNAFSLNRHTNRSDASIVLYSLGMCHLYAKRECGKAMAFFQASIEANPAYWPPYKDFAICLIKKGNFKEAEIRIMAALLLWPNNADLHEALGFLLLKTGKYDQAIIEGRKAFALNPKQYSALNILGEAFRRKGNAQLATFYWEQLVEKYPDNLQGNLALIELYSLQNKKDRLSHTIGKLMIIKGSQTWAELINACLDDADPVAYSPDPSDLIGIIRDAF